MQTYTIDSKLRINRKDWKPSNHAGIHRIDIFMVNANVPCNCGSDCCSGRKHIQKCVIPTTSGVPRFNNAQEFMSEEEIQWCHAENKALLSLYPGDSKFWRNGI